MNKYFVYTGNAYPHKNLKRLVEAMVKLNKDRSDKDKIYLKISSSRNVFTDRLKSLINQYKAGEYIILLGYVPDIEIGKLYENSIAFVFPTLSEGFGLPPMEAINSNTLAVISDIPVLREVYGNSVTYFNPLDVDSITSSLENVLNLNNKKRMEMINESKKYLKKYSWRKMAIETLSLYKSSDN